MLHSFLNRIQKNRGHVSPMKSIIGAFAAIILCGTILLMLPASSAAGERTGFLTALFTATSATCVTGLAVVETGIYWSFFGKIVILLMIQVGGLGFMTVVSVFFFLFNRKIGLKGRMLIAQSFNLNDLQGVVALVRRAIVWTLAAEGIGAVLLTIRFLGRTDFLRALWYGIFHAVSAFCNAGFDILGDVSTGGSMTAYVGDPLVSGTLMALIVGGGLGFFVWNDLYKNRRWSRLSVYSRLVLVITAILLVVGTALFAVFEWNNPETLGSLSAGDKLLAAAFQSVTTRTAGFATIPQDAIRSTSRAVTDFLMFIGGSSGSTAGGVKTVTFGLVVLFAIAVGRGKPRVTVFRRTIAAEQISHAVCIVVTMLALALSGALVISAVDGVDFSRCFYEAVSALATVGLSTGLTPQLDVISRGILTIYMFFGRVGIMTISLAFLLRDPAQERYRLAETKVMLG